MDFGNLLQSVISNVQKKAQEFFAPPSSPVNHNPLSNAVQGIENFGSNALRGAENFVGNTYNNARNAVGNELRALPQQAAGLAQNIGRFAINPKNNPFIAGPPVSLPNLPEVKLPQASTGSPVPDFLLNNVAKPVVENIINTPHNLIKASNQFNQDFRSGQITNPRILAADIGQTLDPALNIATFGGATIPKEIIIQGLKQKLLTGVKEGALTGAKYGFGYGLGSGLASGRDIQNPQDYFTNLSLNTGMGVLTGLGTGGLLGGTSSLIGGTKNILNEVVFKRDPQVTNELITRAQVQPRTPDGQYTYNKLVKPNGMSKAAWDFQVQFNKKYNRNPYQPVYPSDLQNAIQYEAGKKQIGLSIRDVNKDQNPLGALGSQNQPFEPDLFNSQLAKEAQKHKSAEEFIAADSKTQNFNEWFRENWLKKRPRETQNKWVNEDLMTSPNKLVAKERVKDQVYRNEYVPRLINFYNQATKGTDGSSRVAQATATNQLKNNLQTANEQMITQQASAQMAQETRGAFNQKQIGLINQLKQIAKSKAFREGDIETLRNQGKGDIVQKAIEAVREMRPDISTESDALNFALSFPTKSETIVPQVKLTPEEKALRIQALQEQTQFNKEFGKPATAQEQQKMISEWENQIKKETLTLDQLNKSKEKTFNQNFNAYQESLGGTRAYKGGKIGEITGGFPSSALKSGNINDKAPFAYQRETLLRNIEDTFKNPQDVSVVKKYLHEPIVRNETANVNFQNKLRQNLTDTFNKLGIKRGSKEDYAAADYTEKKITLDQLKQQFPNKWQNIVKASEQGRETYRMLLEGINNAITRFGYNPITERQNYVTHTRQIQTLVDRFGSLLNFTKEKLPTEMSAINVDTKPGRQFFRFGLQRQGGSTHEGLITALDKYITPAGNQIFHTQDVQRARALQQFLQKSANPQERTLSNFNSYLGQFADYISGKKSIIDRPIEKVFGRGLLTIGDNLRKRTGANMVGGNISSALTNFIPFTQSLATTSKPAAVKGIYEAALAPAMGINNVDGVQSAFLTRRFPTDQIGATFGSSARNALNFLFKTVDAFTSRSVVAGKYFEGLQKGLPKEQAMAKADEYAARVLADRSFGQVPLIFNSKVLGAFTQFQVEVNNQVSYLLKDIPKNSGYNKAQVASALTQFVIYSYLFNNMFQYLTGRRPQIDPLHAGINLYSGVQQGKSAKDILNPVSQNSPVGEIVQNLPFTSILTGGRIPIGSALPDVSGIAGGTKSLPAEIGKSLALLASPIGGGGQVQKTIQGLTAYNQGYSANNKGQVRYPIEQTPLNLARTTLFGQYSTPESSHYFQNNGKPLSDIQSEFFKASPNKQGVFQAIQDNRQVNNELAKLKQGKNTPIKEAYAKNTNPQVTQLSDGTFAAMIGKKIEKFDTQEAAQLAIDKNALSQSEKNFMLSGNYVLRKSSNGKVTATPKNDFIKTLTDAQMLAAKNTGDTAAWLKANQTQAAIIESQLQDPNIDELEKIKLQNKLYSLMKERSKYQGQGGFRVPKKFNPPKFVPMRHFPMPKQTISNIKLPGAPAIPMQSMRFNIPSAQVPQAPNFKARVRFNL